MRIPTMYFKAGEGHCRVREICPEEFEIAMLEVLESGEVEVFYLERFRTLENALRKLLEKGIASSQEFYMGDAVPMCEFELWVESCV